MIGISRLLAEGEERGRERHQNQQPCLQTDLALIDILSNRRILHLKTVICWILMHTWAGEWELSRWTLRYGRVCKRLLGKMEGGFVWSHSASPWTDGEWPPLSWIPNQSPSRRDSGCKFHFILLYLLSLRFYTFLVHCVTFQMWVVSCSTWDISHQFNLNKDQKR